jgi:predicted deacylase
MKTDQHGLAVTILVLLALPLWGQEFRVGTVSAAPGTVASGNLQVPGEPETQIPITVVHGAKKGGNVLALLAGVHGYEYSSILALQRLRTRLDPRDLAGTVILVHVANVPSFLKRTIYYGPGDGKNLNRVFPGVPNGTQSERIAYVLTREVIERATHVIDMHSGDGNESLRPYTYWSPVGLDHVDAAAKQMALAYGLDRIVIDLDRPRDPYRSLYAQTTAMTRGKPAITTESGRLGEVPSGPLLHDEHVFQHERGALSVMRLLKMIPGEPEMVQQPLWIDRNEVLRSKSTGIFYALVKRDETVAKDTVIGYVTDFFGQKVEEIRAPFGGVVLYVVATPPISSGEPVAMVGHIKE